MTNVTNMTKTTVYIEPDVAQALRQLSAAQRRPQAEMIREALANYTRQAPRPALTGIGKYKSGRSDISERTDDLLKTAARKRRWL